MIAARPTPRQVSVLLDRIREKVRAERVIGIRYEGPWDGPRSLTVASETVDVARLDSPLAIREVLAARSNEAPPLAILTSLGEAELGTDVLARLARRRLFQVDPWEIVQDLFKARSVDPSLASQMWIAELLIEQAPPEGYPPVPSGVLDAETAWRIVLDEGFGLGAATPDAVDVLRWTMDPARLERYRARGAEVRAGVRDWIGRRAGAVGLALLDCVEAGAGLDAVPLGLAGRVVFHPDAATEVTLREAAARLERFWGDRRLEPQVGWGWAAAAEQVVADLAAEQGDPAARPWLERGDAILDGAGAGAYTYLSARSLAGFEQRLARCGSALRAGLERPSAEVEAELLRHAMAVREHAQAAARPDQGERLHMAIRLVRWLGRRRAEPARMPASFEEAADSYLREGGFVDWARTALRGGETIAPLSEAYARVSAAAGEEREQDNREFGRLLANWSAVASSGRGVCLIEDVLAATVGPLARSHPVLLIVVDGMSVAVWRELLEDLVAPGWVPVAPAGSTHLPPVIAAFPTVTEVSRASLLCGRITTGAGATEKAGFAAHPGLLAASKPKTPPVLFHKADLTTGGGSDLADPVRDAIAAADRRVVGVVLNAVDDFLLKPDQVRPRWTLASIPLLDALLYAARAAGRLVVLTSDHGHVLDTEARVARFDQGDRWRADDGGGPQPDEIVLTGPRVASAPGAPVIAPWSERTRYGIKKNGYHGGATPQEVIVPLSVLAPPGVVVEAWSEASMDYPGWWEASPEPGPVAAPRPRRPTPAAGRNLAFDFLPPATPPGDSRWIEALFASTVYTAQRELAGRVAPPDDRVRQVLEALDQRGGKLTRAALAHRLGQPPVRVNGIVAALRRVLNVEGYPILSVDEASDTVELNRELLRVQFGL